MCMSPPLGPWQREVFYCSKSARVPLGQFRGNRHRLHSELWSNSLPGEDGWEESGLTRMSSERVRNFSYQTELAAKGKEEERRKQQIKSRHGESQSQNSEQSVAGCGRGMQVPMCSVGACGGVPLQPPLPRWGLRTLQCLPCF